MSATSYPTPFEEKPSPRGYPVTCKAEKLNYIKHTSYPVDWRQVMYATPPSIPTV